MKPKFKSIAVRVEPEKGVEAETVVVRPVDASADVSEGWCHILVGLLDGQSLPKDGEALQTRFTGCKLVLVERLPANANVVGKDTKVKLSSERVKLVVNEHWERDARELVAGYDPILTKMLTACKNVFCRSEGSSNSNQPFEASNCLLRAPRLWQILGPPGSGKSHLATSLATSSGLPYLMLDQGMLQNQPQLKIHDVVAAVETTAPCFVIIERAEDTPHQVLRTLAQAIERWHDNNTPIFIFCAGSFPAVLTSVYCPISSVTLYPLSEDGRLAILTVLCKNLYLESNDVLDEVVKFTPGFAPCDLDELVRAVALRAAAKGSPSQDSSTSAQDSSTSEDSARVVVANDFISMVDTIVPSALRQQGALATTSVTTGPRKDFDIIYPSGRGRGFDGVIGQEKLVSGIRDYLHDFLYSRAKGKNLTICGAPGSGKTHIAEAIAAEGHAHLFFLTPATILRKNLGESERTLAQIFDDARTAAPSVIVMESIDYWGAENDGTEHKTMRRLIATLVGQLDLLDSMNQRVCVVATCHTKGVFPDRVRLGPVFDLPDQLPPTAVHTILKAYLQGRAATDITDDDLMRLVDECNAPFSDCRRSIKQVADIVHWCREAAVAAVRRGVLNSLSDIQITLDDLRSSDTR